MPEIGRDMRIGGVETARRTEVSGLAAAQARVALSARGSARTAELTVVRLGGRLYRLTGLRLPDDAAAASALAAAAASFRPLSAAQAARLQPLRIRIHRIAPGEDVAALAGAMPVGAAARARFDLMNGLGPRQGLRVGDEVKLVSE